MSLRGGEADVAIRLSPRPRRGAPMGNAGSPRRGRRPLSSRLASPERGGGRAACGEAGGGAAVQEKMIIRCDLRLFQPLSHRRQTAATAPLAGEPAPLHAAGDGVRLVVPGKHIGLTLFLVFSDRCGNCRFPSSDTGGGNPQFLDVPIKKRKNIPLEKRKIPVDRRRFR